MSKSKIRWLLEPDVFNGDLEPFIEALDRMGVSHTEVKFGVPYSEYITPKFGEKVVVLGSFQLVEEARQNGRFGVFEKRNNKYDCTYYYPRFGKHILNSEYMMLPLGDLLRKKDGLCCPAYDLFIRPNSGAKSFGGRVVSYMELESAVRGWLVRNEPETLVVVGGVRNIFREWRLVVVDNRVVAGSQYKQDSEVVRVKEVPDEVMQYGTIVLDEVKYSPDRAWTLDICESSCGLVKELKVLEVGTFSCAGLYAADPGAVIAAIHSTMG